MYGRRLGMLLMGAAMVFSYQAPPPYLSPREVYATGPAPYRSKPLTNKQKKARAKSVRARKARRKNRGR